MVYRTFPFRLHLILEETSKDQEESSIISWKPDGKTFKIHNPEAFKETILPKYLPKQSKYKSFKRQLQYYGFTNHGSNTYGHHSFLRDEKSLLSRIEHRALKKTKAVNTDVAPSTSNPRTSSNSVISQDSKDLKVPEDDVVGAYASSTPLVGAFPINGTSFSGNSASVQSSSLLRDTLLPTYTNHQPTNAGLQSRLLLSLAAGKLPSHGLASLGVPSSLMPSLPPRQEDDVTLVSPSLLHQSSSHKGAGETTSTTNCLISTLLAGRQLSSPSPSLASLVAPSPSPPASLLALELEYQRQRQHQEAQEAATRAQYILSLTSPPTQTTEQTRSYHHNND